MVENDLHEVYGIDVGDKQLMHDRSWRWLRVRVLGLVWEPGTRLQRVLHPELQPVHNFGYKDWQRINNLRTD